MKEETWCAVDVIVDSAAAEAIEFALNQLNSLGTEINNLGKKTGDTICVTGYFSEESEISNFKFQISDALRIYGFEENSVKSVVWNEVENRDWLAEWKKHWKPTEIGKFIIAPPWEDVETTSKILIRIEPNMAFGTGTHETTQLCLKAIGEAYDPNQSFLDVGTGTGILAIAAAKLTTEENIEIENKKHSGQILACDTDLDSVKIARENAVANNVDGQIDFFDGSIDKKTPVFDFVCANLTIDVIVPILPLLIEKSRSVLLLSGILATQQNAIEHEINKFPNSNFKCEAAGEWISVLISR